MSDYPKTVSARKAMRTQIRNEVLAEAEGKARERGRSIKCGEWGRHAGDSRLDGCKNDGSNCICECHDQAGDGENAV